MAPAVPIAATDGATAYLPGSGSVTSKGEYQYNIPLKVPPGRAGMEPHLALTYSSRGGDGVAGLGWSVSGLSEIHRCAKMPASEGESDGANFDATDVFCLDDNKLIPLGGGSYQTERQTFDRIQGTRGGFLVSTKDGRILEYDGLPGVDGTPLGVRNMVWPLVSERDRLGNEVRYHYDYDETSGFSYRIKSIDYTTEYLSGPPGTRKVEFSYVPRDQYLVGPDETTQVLTPTPLFAYVAGHRFETNSFLASIVMSAPAADGTPVEVWRYSLDFGLFNDDNTLAADFPGASRIEGTSSIKLCARGTCTRSKVFHYGQEVGGFDVVGGFTEVTTAVIDAPLTVGSPIVLDADGDGRDDLFYVAGPEGQLLLSTPISNGGALLGEKFNVPNIDDPTAIPVDVDGDGVVEILAYHRFTSEWRLYRWNNSGAGTMVDVPSFIPVAVSPKMLPQAQMFGANAVGPGWVVQLSDLLGTERPGFVDLDGDGLPDMVKVHDPTANGNYTPGVRVWMNKAGTFQAFVDFSGPNFIDWAKRVQTRQNMFAVDQFGDHRGGMYTRGTWGNRSVLHIDDAQNLVTTTVPDPNFAGWCIGSFEIVDVDANGDGLRDVCCQDGSGVGCAFNDGAGHWLPSALPTWEFRSYGHGDLLAMDLNSDGYEDLVMAKPAQDDAQTCIVNFTMSTGAAGYVSGGSTGVWYPRPCSTVRQGDFDGDGTKDFAIILDDNTLHVTVHPTVPGQLLVAVGDEKVTANAETIEYAQWAPPNGPIQDCKFPEQCVRRGNLTVVKSHGVMNPALNDFDISYYAYEDARVDVHGRGFLGFHTVREWYPQRPMQITTTYDNVTAEHGSYPYADVPKQTEVIIPILDVPPAGRTSADMPTGASARLSQVDALYQSEWSNNDRVFWVHPSSWQSEEWEQGVLINWDPNAWDHILSRDGLDPRTHSVLRHRSGQSSYDTYGNALTQTSATEGGTRYEVDHTYDNRVNDWLLGLVTSTTERSARSANQAFVTRYTTFHHDALGLLDYTEIEPLAISADLHETIHFSRNSSGLVTAARRDAPGQAPRQVNVEYDADNFFPKVTWNDLGHARWALYDAGLGLPTVTLQNASLTQFVHDGLGRIREVLPEGAGTTSTTYAISDGDVKGSSTITTTQAGDQTEVDFDAFERQTTIQRLGFSGELIESATTYDALGGARQVSRPGVNAPSMNHTAFLRDSLNRLLEEDRPDGTTIKHAQSFFATSTSDAKNATVSTIIRDLDDRVATSISYPLGIAATTTFGYAEFNLLESVLDDQQNKLGVTYDTRGRRMSVTDPDAGSTAFAYNGFGELRSSANAVDSTAFYRDLAGRVIKTDDVLDGQTTYNWDLTPSGIGQLGKSTSPDGTVTERSYDDEGRLKTMTWTIDGNPYEVVLHYESLGRIDSIAYPQVPNAPRFTVGLSYNSHDYLFDVSDMTLPGPATIWEAESRNVDGALTAANLGDLVELSRTYDDATGRLKNIGATSLGTAVFDAGYDYDANGAVWHRSDAVAGRTETFLYDEAARLTDWTLVTTSGSHTRKYGYDSIGNLKQVLVGGQPIVNNVYGASGLPHALDGDTIAGTNFGYDQLGRQTSGGGRLNVSYTNFGLPKNITTPSGETDFSYDAQKTRVKKAGPDGTTITLGGLYERTSSAAGVQHVFHVIGGDGPVAEVVFDESTNAYSKRYVITDKLGSSSLVDEDGSFERLHYDPFGGRIDSNGSPVADALTTQNGFTGQRHDDDLGVIDMRGRIYDPKIGRFLTPDPLVSFPAFGQSYNRYSYVLNNPTNLVDPSGLGPEGGSPPPGSPQQPGQDTHTYGPGPGDFGHAIGQPGAGALGTPGGGGIPAPAWAGPSAVRGDADGYQGYGCPRSTGGTAHGPCPPGVVGACGGDPRQISSGLSKALTATGDAVEGWILRNGDQLGRNVAIGVAVPVAAVGIAYAGAAAAAAFSAETVAAAAAPLLGVGLEKLEEAGPEIENAIAELGTGVEQLGEEALTAIRLPQVAGTGFESFIEFKEAFGSVAPDFQWHHIVEQNAGNLERFGEEAIHNTNNLIPVETGVHQQISAFYSSKPDFAGGLRVREWLASQGFDDQKAFGIKVLLDFGGL